MRKALMAAVLLVAVAAFLLVSGTGSVARADGGPAVVIKNGGLCGMPGSDADGNIIFGGTGQVTTSVTNGNKAMIKCMGTDITNLSGSGQSFNGFSCGLIDGNGNFQFTTDSHATVSASGVGTLTCTFKFS
jgi:hypothetical protein